MLEYVGFNPKQRNIGLSSRLRLESPRYCNPLKRAVISCQYEHFFEEAFTVDKISLIGDECLILESLFDLLLKYLGCSTDEYEVYPVDIPLLNDLFDPWQV